MAHFRPSAGSIKTTFSLDLPVFSAFRAVLLGGIAAALLGCGSSMKATLQKEWETEAGEARTLMVEPEREQLLVGEGENITIHNGNGSLLYGEEESMSLGEIAAEATQVADVSLGSMEADQFKYMIQTGRGGAGGEILGNTHTPERP